MVLDLRSLLTGFSACRNKDELGALKGSLGLRSAGNLWAQLKSSFSKSGGSPHLGVQLQSEQTLEMGHLTGHQGRGQAGYRERQWAGDSQS